jgi:hypothetical protein
MGNVFFFLMAAAMAAVAGVLVVGLVSMIRGGTFNERNANRLMRARLYLQAAALGLFVLAFISRA